MGDHEVITLSSDDEDSTPPANAVPVIKKVISLPAAESARHISTALSRAPLNRAREVKKRPERERDPNLVFSVRTKGDTSDDDAEEIQDITPVTKKEHEVVTVDDDEDEVIDEDKNNVAKEKIKKASSSIISNGSGSGHASGISVRSEITEVMDNDDQKSEISLASSSAATASTDFTQASRRELNRFCKLLKSRLIPKDCKKISSKLVNRYQKYVQSQSKEFHEKFAMKLASGIRKIQDGENEWARINKITQYMKPEEVKFARLQEMDVYETSDDESAQADREAEKKKRILKLEKELAKIHEKIRELDEQEVDLFNEEDEHNSAYILSEKLKEKSVKVFYRICEVTKSLTKTGRPTQKKIVIEKTTNYPELEQAVQDFMNKGNHLFSPDFADIFSVVSAENSKLHLSNERLHSVAVELHKQVVLKIQERRKLDTLLAFPSSIDLGARDPAEDDAELARKLDENKSKGRTIDSVVDEFVQRAATEQTEEDDDGDEESSVDSDEETENDNNNVDNLEDLPLTEEYATGPEGECLGDDEEDEDQELLSQQLASENAVLSNPQSNEEAKENSVEVGTDTGEPEAKKVKLI